MHRSAQAIVERFELDTPWDTVPRRQLSAAYAAADGRKRAFVTDQPLAAFPLAEFDARADAARAAIVDVDAPIALEPATVSKPWGREVWYSGFERRGVARATDGRHATPLPLALALLGFEPSDRLVLAKILEPRHEPLVGELYFEVHDEKHEVYVVTDVDPRAWPDGVGMVRFGMSPELRAQYRDDDRFRADYAAAARRYRGVRAQLDEASAPDDALVREETERRGEMTRFVRRCALRVGDVVSVPPGLPHGLEHGVRVIEFQTPVFERRILSFAQRAATQEEWDTDAAVPRMRIDAPPLAQPELVRDDAAVRIERLARCPDFDIWRVRLAAGASWQMPAASRPGVCIALGDGLVVGALALAREQACLVPGNRRPLRTTNSHATDWAELLIAAEPDRSASASETRR